MRLQNIPVVFEEVTIEQAFRADLIVESKVLVELKAMDVIPPAHYKKLLPCLKLTKLKVGLMMNLMRYC
jgi:GxxExxY protein